MKKRKNNKEKGLKFDTGKIRTDLVNPDFILNVAKALTHGANKYGANNWQLVEEGQDRYYAAAMRHLLAWRNGEKVDQESGLSHLTHVATNMMFLEYLDKDEFEIEKEIKKYYDGFNYSVTYK